MTDVASQTLSPRHAHRQAKGRARSKYMAQQGDKKAGRRGEERTSSSFHAATRSTENLVRRCFIHSLGTYPFEILLILPLCFSFPAFIHSVCLRSPLPTFLSRKAGRQETSPILLIDPVLSVQTLTFQPPTHRHAIERKDPPNPFRGRLGAGAHAHLHGLGGHSCAGPCLDLGIRVRKVEEVIDRRVLCRVLLLCPGDVQPCPDIVEGVHQSHDVVEGVEGTGGHSKPLSSLGDSGVVDGLDVHPVGVEELVRGSLAESGVSHVDGHNVGGVVHHGQVLGLEHVLQLCDLQVLCLSLCRGLLQVTDGGSRSGSNHGRERSGEDEARRVGADSVHKFGGARNVPSEDSYSLSEGAIHDVHSVCCPDLLAHPCPSRSVHAHSMDLVDVRHGSVLLGQIAYGVDGGDGSVHRVDRLEHDQLGSVCRGSSQKFLEVLHVVVSKNLLLAF
mmetsp:Transcript_33833/g.67020  ORF Transcript_33833/g.67020 Transcript_33833/m.67020 type:complete len:445 (-) Transcript_33833:996-2330(-)